MSTDLKKLVLNARKRIVKDNRYAVTNFRDTKLLIKYGIPNDPIFRFWDTVEPPRHRVLYLSDKNSMFIDSVYDYPLVAIKRLGRNRWEDYNKGCLVQIGSCSDLYCCHCYLPTQNIKGDISTLEFVTPTELVNRYLEERKAYSEKSDYEINLLRISGGEPFLVPDLVLQVLNELKSRNLDDEIFVWSETNLTPFARPSSEAKTAVEEIEIDIAELSKFKNFALHPCFHGISAEDFIRNTIIKDVNFTAILDAFATLINAGIDVYPTFGYNVNNPANLPSFFNAVRSINRNVLRRFALIEYKWDYSPVIERLECWGENTSKALLSLLQVESSRNSVLLEWERLLINEFGLGYLVTNRPDVSI